MGRIIRTEDNADEFEDQPGETDACRKADLDGLERLAKAAVTAKAFYDDHPIGGAMAAWNSSVAASEAFEVAANPATVLALITAAREAEALRGATLSAGDLWWNPNDPENGFNCMEDAFGDATQWDHDGPVKLDRARSLPPVWALAVHLDTTGDGEADDYEIRLFATEAEAAKHKADIKAELSAQTDEGEAR